MPLLDIEKPLFVCKPFETTVQIPVKNVGNHPLRLQKVVPIGECAFYIKIDPWEQQIGPKESTDITVKIEDYWKPAKIQFETNCRRTGKTVYVLRPQNSRGPNLWMLPNENYNEDQVFFRDPEQHLRLPVIVQSHQDNPLELNFCPTELKGEKASESSYASRETAAFCEETKRKTSRQGNGPCYQILNSQGTYQLHSIHIYFSPAVIRDGPGEQEIQLRICTNSYLTELRSQEVSIKLPKVKNRLIARRGFWSKLRKTKIAELQIENLATYPVRIFKILADPNKIQVIYLETNGKRTNVHYPIVIPENDSKKICFAIKSSLKEWLWSGTDLCKQRVKICSNTTFNPENSSVFANKVKIQSERTFWLTLGIVIFTISVSLFLFFRQLEYDVMVLSSPHGQVVHIDGRSVGQTPIKLKVKESSEIQIGNSRTRHVKDVVENGRIIFPGKTWGFTVGERE